MSNGQHSVLRLPMMLGAVAVLAVGLGASARHTRNVDVSPELRSVVGAPAKGLTLDTVGDGLKNWSMIEFLGNFPDYSMALYGTSGDPSSPSILLGQYDGMSGLFYGGDEVLDAHGVRCTTDKFDTLRCSVQVGTRGLVAAHSHGLALADVQRMLREVTDVGGNPRIPAAELPAGMRLLKTRSQQRDGSINDPYVGGLHGAQASYSDAQGRTLSLVVGRTDEQELAEVTMVPFTRRTIDGVDYHTFDKLGLSWVLWQTDGKAFYLLSKGIDLDAMLTMARSVRPATAAEWAAAPKDPNS